MAEYRKNLANAIVGTMTASTSATSIPLQTGYGATMPAVPFFMTYTPPGQLSTMGNSEIVLVSAISTDTLTVVRAQKGTTARLIGTGWIGSASILRETSLAVGDIITTLNTSPSSGRLFMDGGTYNKSDYPLLYDHVANNSNYGTTSGGTTFTLKDMRGRVPVGKTASGTFATLAATGGAETHILSTAEMPSHTHTFKWRVNFPKGTGSLGTNDLSGDALLVSDNMPGGNSTSGYDWSGGSNGNNATGGGGAHNNLQPYIVINYEVVAS